jgi:hypothetical protein
MMAGIITLPPAKEDNGAVANVLVPAGDVIHSFGHARLMDGRLVVLFPGPKLGEHALDLVS